MDMETAVLIGRYRDAATGLRNLRDQAHADRMLRTTEYQAARAPFVDEQHAVAAELRTACPDALSYLVREQDITDQQTWFVVLGIRDADATNARLATVRAHLDNLISGRVAA